MKDATKQRMVDLISELISEGEQVQQLHYAFTTTERDGAKWVRAQGAWEAKCRTLFDVLGEHGTKWAEPFFQEGENARTGMLEGIKHAIEGDWLLSVEDLIYAEAFSDLLEQADHLLSQQYTLAAGVLGRAVLEEHLRKMCERLGCVPAKPKPTMVDYKSELYRNDHIRKIDQSHVDSMAAIGNDAAHNKAELRREDVERLLRDVRGFLSNHPV
jgi:hypothetical protein